MHYTLLSHIITLFTRYNDFLYFYDIFFIFYTFLYKYEKIYKIYKNKYGSLQLYFLKKLAFYQKIHLIAKKVIIMYKIGFFRKNRHF